jgi:hypothetical protein
MLCHAALTATATIAVRTIRESHDDTGSRSGTSGASGATLLAEGACAEGRD